MSYLMGKGPNGQPLEVAVDADGKVLLGTVTIDDSTPARLPLQQQVSLGAPAVDLGASISDLSDAGWELVGDGDWAIGIEASQLRAVSSGEVFTVPSSSLSGWWASAGGAVVLTATGAS